MKIILRLYRVHDLDLVALYNVKEFNFIGAIKASIRSYIKGEPIQIAMPILPDYTTTHFKSNYPIVMTLKEDKDADLIEFLQNVKSRLRNGAVKAILRQALIGSAISAYMNDTSYLQKNNSMNSFMSSNMQSLSFFKDTIYKKKHSKDVDNKIKLRDSTKTLPQFTENKAEITKTQTVEVLTHNKEFSIQDNFHNNNNELNFDEDIDVSSLNAEENIVDDETNNAFASAFSSMLANANW